MALIVLLELLQMESCCCKQAGVFLCRVFVCAQALMGFFVLINCSEVDLEWCGRAVYRELHLAHSQIPDKPDHIWHFDFFLTQHADDVLLNMSESNLSFSKRKHII